MDIYLDNAATTKTDRRVVNAMLPYFEKEYANASSLHIMGSKAARDIDIARSVCARAINCDDDEIIFLSGGTEANNFIFNLALTKGKNHIITTAVEHHSVLSGCERLKEKGAKIDLIGVDQNGCLNIDDIEKLIGKKTALISVMDANNEIGNLYQTAKIGALAKKYGVLFHTDAVASFGKRTIDVQKENIDFLSVSSHKFYGPKGVGFLYVRRGCNLSPLMIGGGQEFGLRAGTLNTPAVIGTQKAVELAFDKPPELAYAGIGEMKQHFIDEILKNIPGSFFNGERVNALPTVINFSFADAVSSDLIGKCSQMGLMVSSGSACLGGGASHVIEALHKYDTSNTATMRISMSRDTKPKHLFEARKIIAAALSEVRAKKIMFRV